MNLDEDIVTQEMITSVHEIKVPIAISVTTAVHFVIHAFNEIYL